MCEDRWIFSKAPNFLWLKILAILFLQSGIPITYYARKYSEFYKYLVKILNS